MSAHDRRRLEQASGRDERSPLLDALAASAADGDLDAAETLAWAVQRFRLARPALNELLFKEQDIEIAEQRTMVAVALKLGGFRSEARFTTWLHRIALNEAKQLLRSEARRRNRSPGREPLEELADHFVARVSSMIVDQGLVAAAIEALPDDHRQALLLREEQGLAYSEIAESLGVPESTAKTWVRRARIGLAERLADSMGRA